MLDEIERTTEMALEMLDQWGKGMNRMLPATGPGTHRPTAYELAMFVQQVTAQYPPMPWNRPDGTQVVASPYLLALGETENGKALLKRISKLYEEA